MKFCVLFCKNNNIYLKFNVRISSMVIWQHKFGPLYTFFLTFVAKCFALLNKLIGIESTLS